MNSMRKIWTQEQDKTIRHIITQMNVKKWSQVARIMERDFNIIGRTGKQCRERWHNQLDPSIKSDKWTQNEQETLYRYHDTYGNKWAKIAVHLPGRTDNCVKNHFYSNLRKALRRINLFILGKKLNKEFKQIRNSVLPKIIAGAEQRFTRKSNPLSDEMIKRCTDVKNKVSSYCNVAEPTQAEIDDLTKLVEEIHDLANFFKNSKTKQKNEKVEQQPQIIKEEKKQQSPPPAIRRPPMLQSFRLTEAAITEGRDKSPLLKRMDSINKDSSEQPAVVNTANQIAASFQQDSEAMEQPIVLDTKALGLELDSPTLPGFRFRKRRSQRINGENQPLDQLDIEEVKPSDAVIRLLNGDVGY